MLFDLIDADRQQFTMFDTPQSETERKRSAKLMGMVDDLNRRIDRGTIKLGTPSPGAAWHLSCDNRTQRYSTSWDELLRAKALSRDSRPNSRDESLLSNRQS